MEIIITKPHYYKEVALFIKTPASQTTNTAFIKHYSPKATKVYLIPEAIKRADNKH